MMGPRQVEQGALFYNFSLDRHVPADHLLRSVDRFIARGAEARAGAVLQRDGPALGRSGVDDPDADPRLLLRHPLGAATLRRGPPEPRLSLVLPPWPRWSGAGPLDLLQEPARPLPGQRPPAAPVRDRARPVHRRGPGRWRGFCS